MNHIPFPSPNFGRLLTTFVVAFGFLAAGVAIIVWAIDGPKLWVAILVLLAVAAVSVVLAVVPYVYDAASVVKRRVCRYPKIVERAANFETRLSSMREYLTQLSADLPIRAITERDGTVHLIFPYGTSIGLGHGSTIEVVRETGRGVLGLVEVIEATAVSCFAVPIDRRDPDFWEGLEDRMKHDFSPPSDVVGRVFKVTDVVLSDLLGAVRE